jgi:single-stranded-DNA-specific exonuclease
MKYHWHIAPAQPMLAGRLSEALHLPISLAQCLINRGFFEPENASLFLQPKLRQLADPFQLPQMHQAVTRIYQALERSETVVIFGDFDVDGITSTALLAEVLTSMGLKLFTYLPRRFDEGYGLSLEAAQNCQQRHPVSLLIAVDCGSTAVPAVEWLRSQGVEVVVLDHHQVSNPPPPAVALVNPRMSLSRHDDRSKTVPFEELSSVGLAFKLSHALIKHGREQQHTAALAFDLRPLLDLVALGTIADLVPLLGENRILVSVGLDWLSRTQRPGLMALKEIADTKSPIGVYEVGFQLAPRLNAAGRLETAEAALQLLRARDLEEARPLAQLLDSQNRERQQIERNITEDVIGAVRSRFDPARDYVIVEGQDFWHVGVVGIVAARVMRAFHRPAIIMGGDVHEWRGSGRSIEGFNLAAALRSCSDILRRHGGHAMAAGLTVAPERVPEFRQRLNDLAQKTLRPDQLRPGLRLDEEVTLPQITLELVEFLRVLSPNGMGNPPVHWMVRSVHHVRPPQRMGRDQQHARCWLTDGHSSIEAVMWNVPDNELPRDQFDLAFIPEINDFNGRKTVQLRILDWCPTAAS